MKRIFILLLAALAIGCDVEASKPAPSPPETGREAMAVDGTKPGVLERQPSGTYLLRHSDNSATKVSANEVVLMPEVKK